MGASDPFRCHWFSLPLVLAMLAGVGASVLGADQGAVEIQYAAPFTFGRERFVGLAEYLGAAEKDRRREVVRTDPAERAGDYFIVRLDRDVGSLQPDSRIWVDLVTSAAPFPRSRSFDIPRRSEGAREIYVGFTGDSRITPEHRILAFQIRLTGPSGEALAEYESFLWEVPGEESPLPASASEAEGEPGSVETLSSESR